MKYILYCNSEELLNEFYEKTPVNFEKNEEANITLQIIVSDKEYELVKYEFPYYDLYSHYIVKKK